jgi:hypothetical protein
LCSLPLQAPSLVGPLRLQRTGGQLAQHVLGTRSCAGAGPPDKAGRSLLLAVVVEWLPQVEHKGGDWVPVQTVVPTSG